MGAVKHDILMPRVEAAFLGRPKAERQRVLSGDRIACLDATQEENSSAIQQVEGVTQRPPPGRSRVRSSRVTNNTGGYPDYSKIAARIIGEGNEKD